MAKIETAAYAAERVKLQTKPVYFARFSHVKKFGDGTDYAFSVDFSTDSVLAPTATKRPYMVRPGGAVQQIDHENGRSSIGTLSFRILDSTGEFLKYLAAPALTLAAAMDAAQLTATVNEDPSGMPAQGTLEITTGGAIERARYSSYNATTKVFTLTARGVDGTTAAPHALNDAVTNGEQIRPGQRVQLFSGYDAINEADYMSWPKMEVTARQLLQDRVTFEVQALDIQRSIRRTVFLTATADAPFTLTDNPITVLLKVLLSTGTGTNGVYDVLAAADGLGVPQALVDVAGLESLRDTEFVGETYVFSVTEPQNGKQFLEEQIFKTANLYPVVKQDGKLSAKRYKAAGTAVATLDESAIVSWGWAMGDQQVINEVAFEYDWDLPDKRGVFGKRQIYTHQGSIDKYGRRPPLTISSWGIKTANGGQAILDNRAFEVIKLFAEPPLVLTVDTFYRHHVLEAGDNVSVTHALIPNPKTGKRGLAAERFMVLNVEPRFDAGLVRFRLLWVGGIPAQTAPGSGGAVTTPIPIRDDQAPAVPTGLAAATGTVVDADGTVQVFLDYSWAANTEADLDRYELQFKRQADAAFTSVLVPKGTTAHRVTGAVGNVAHDARIRAIDVWGNASAFSTVVTITTAKDTAAPAAPTGVTGSGAVEGALLAWTPPADKDYAGVEVWRNTVNNRLTATKVAETGPVSVHFDSPLNALTTYFYWLRSRDTSGNLSAFHAGDAAGLAVTTAGKVGFKLTLQAQKIDVFTGSFADSVGLASMVFDSADQEVDWLVRMGGDLHFGETSRTAVVITALGLKFAGETFVAAAFDGTDHQVATILANRVRYGRLDKNGTVLAALADKFTPPDNDRYVRAACAAQGASLHWALILDVLDAGGALTQSKLQYARTDLTGTVVVAPTDVAGATSTVPGEEVRIGVDSEGNAHIFYGTKTILAFQRTAFQLNAFQAALPEAMQYVKVSNLGAILVGPTAVLAPAPGTDVARPAAVLVDAADLVHVIAYTFSGVGGLMLAYGRISKAGAVLVPLNLFYAQPTTIRFAVGAMDTANRQIHIAIATTGAISQLRLDPVDPTGDALESVLVKGGL